MKADELIKAIRKLVRDEVKKVVTEEVNKSMTRLLAEVINRNPNEAAVAIREEAQPQKTYTKDNRLNEALNSTVTNLRQREPRAPHTSPMVSLSDMFDKIDAGEDVITQPTPSPIDTSTKLGMLKSIVSNGPINQQTSVLDHVHATPIANVFKKDFRSMMKKIDEKQKKGGSFFAGSVPLTPTMGGYDSQ